MPTAVINKIPGIAGINNKNADPEAATPNKPLPIIPISINLIPSDIALNPFVINGPIAPTAVINKIPGIAGMNNKNAGPEAAIPNMPIPITPISIILIPVATASNPFVINGPIAPTADINKIPGIAGINNTNAGPEAAIPNMPIPITDISINLIPSDIALNPSVINLPIAPTAAIDKIPGIAGINNKNAGPLRVIPSNPFNISPSGLNDLIPSAKFFKKSFIFCPAVLFAVGGTDGIDDVAAPAALGTAGVGVGVEIDVAADGIWSGPGLNDLCTDKPVAGEPVTGGGGCVTLPRNFPTIGIFCSNGISIPFIDWIASLNNKNPAIVPTRPTIPFIPTDTSSVIPRSLENLSTQLLIPSYIFWNPSATGDTILDAPPNLFKK